MSKPTVALQIDLRRFLHEIDAQKRGRLSEIAELCGVSRQAVNSWLKNTAVPPAAMVKLAKKFNWTPDTVQIILGPQNRKNEKTKLRRLEKAVARALSVLNEFQECPHCGRHLFIGDN